MQTHSIQPLIKHLHCNDMVKVLDDVVTMMQAQHHDALKDKFVLPERMIKLREM